MKARGVVLVSIALFAGIGALLFHFAAMYVCFNFSVEFKNSFFLRVFQDVRRNGK